MRSARHPMPPHIRVNETKEGYQIIENGVTYTIQFRELMRLKDYYKKFNPESKQKKPTVAGWYKDLDRFSRKNVKKDGNISSPDGIDFFPDVEYD